MTLAYIPSPTISQFSIGPVTIHFYALCILLGIVLAVTRDGWLSLFMAAVVVPNTTLLPLLCIVMLPAWLLLAGKPMMMVNRPKQQPPHDNV